MYIFELLYNVIHKITRHIKNKPQEVTANVETETCSHVFLPVDSTKRILACTKCGILIKAENLKIRKDKPLNNDKGSDNNQSL